MKTIYNWILILAFAFIIFGLERLDIALFILVLLWVGSHSTLDRHKKFIHVFQILNDLRFFVLSEKVGLSKQDGIDRVNELEMERLSEKEREKLYKDMDYLGM